MDENGLTTLSKHVRELVSVGQEVEELEFLLDNSSVRRVLVLFGVVLALYAGYFMVVFLSNRAVLRLRGKANDTRRSSGAGNEQDRRVAHSLNRPSVVIATLLAAVFGLFGLLLWMTRISC
jgi:hypothetical protein